jgi:uncharacterized protein YdaU (DUF1376 family)
MISDAKFPVGNAARMGGSRMPYTFGSRFPLVRRDPTQYYRHFPGDYLRDTVHLSTLEDCFYRRMLDQVYTTERPLPLDLTRLYAMVRAQSEDDRKAVDSVLYQYFKRMRSGFVNSRASFEIKRKREISTVRAKAGRQRVKPAANAQQKLSKSHVIQNQNQSIKTLPNPLASREGNGVTQFTLAVYGQTVVIEKPKNRRLWTQYEKDGLHGHLADEYVNFFRSKGFNAWIESKNIEA